MTLSLLLGEIFGFLYLLVPWVDHGVGTAAHHHHQALLHRLQEPGQAHTLDLEMEIARSGNIYFLILSTSWAVSIGGARATSHLFTIAKIPLQ